MTISLHVEYHAQWGSQLYVTTGAKPSFGQKLPATAIDMDNDGRGNWFVDVDATLLEGKHYHYVLAYQRHVLRTEFGNGHSIAGIADAQGVPTLHVWDIWRRLPQIRSFFSLAYRRRNEIRNQQNSVQTLIDDLRPNRLTMVCEAGKLRDEWQLALIGNVPELGSWDPSRALPMEQVSRDLWCISIDRSELRYPLRFKFIVLERRTRHFVGWEDCTNRYFLPCPMEDGDSLLICDQRFTRLAKDAPTDLPQD